MQKSGHKQEQNCKAPGVTLSSQQSIGEHYQKEAYDNHHWMHFVMDI